MFFCMTNVHNQMNITCKLKCFWASQNFLPEKKWFKFFYITNVYNHMTYTYYLWFIFLGLWRGSLCRCITIATVSSIVSAYPTPFTPSYVSARFISPSPRPPYPSPPPPPHSHHHSPSPPAKIFSAIHRSSWTSMCPVFCVQPYQKTLQTLHFGTDIFLRVFNTNFEFSRHYWISIQISGRLHRFLSFWPYPQFCSSYSCRLLPAQKRCAPFDWCAIWHGRDPEKIWIPVLSMQSSFQVRFRPRKTWSCMYV